MKNELDTFLAEFPELEQMPSREQVAIFGFFLTEVAGDKSITPKRLRECFDTAAISAPGNISDVIAKSKFFVVTQGGLQLQRFKRNEIRSVINGGEAREVAALPTNGKQAAMAQAPGAETVAGLSKNVMVVYGRNQGLRDGLFDFLRALKLNPIEWSEAVRATGKGSPYVGEILDAAFRMAQAIIVLLTADERVELREELCSSSDEFAREQGFQPRPNVLIEAGMALGRAENRTILVEVGQIRQASDLHGRHLVRLDDSPEKRNELAQRLSTAGCEPDTSNQDWYRAGTFKTAMKRRTAR